jgi:hypothetical protein
MKKTTLFLVVALAALACLHAQTVPGPFTGSWRNNQGAVWTFTDSEVSQPGAPGPRDYSHEDNVARWEGVFEPYAYYRAVLSADGKTFTVSAESSMDGTQLFTGMVFTKQ